MTAFLFCSFIFFIYCNAPVKRQTPSTPGFTLVLEDSTNLGSLVNNMAYCNEFDERSTGIGGFTSDQYKRYQHLSRIATENELVKLTDHPNACVKAYAFRALREKKSGKLQQILEKHLSDSTGFDYVMYCSGSQKQLNAFYISECDKIFPIELITKYKKAIKTQAAR